MSQASIIEIPRIFSDSDLLVRIGFVVFKAAFLQPSSDGAELGKGKKYSHNVPSVPLTSHTLANTGRINIPSQSRFNEQHEENICLWPWSWCLTAWKRLLRLEQQHTISDTKGHEHDSTDGSPSSQGKYSHYKIKKLKKHRASQQQLESWCPLWTTGLEQTQLKLWNPCWVCIHEEIHFKRTTTAIHATESVRNHISVPKGMSMQ